MPEAESEHTAVDANKAQAIVKLLQMITAGPSEAYATLMVAVLMLNDMCDEPVTIDALVAEVSMSLRSVQSGSVQ